MPATSLKQKKFMDAAAHNPQFAKQVGIPQSVAKEFSTASKGIEFKGGSRTRPDLQKVNKPKTLQGKTELYNGGGEMKESKAMAKKEVSFMQKKGAPKSMIKHEKEEYGMKKGGMKKMANGGSASARADGVAQRGKTKGKMLAKGGKAYC